jgi:hypothetical protein
MKSATGILFLLSVFACLARPPLRVIHPNGGESFCAGDTLIIRWEIDPDSVSSRGVTVDISTLIWGYWVSVNMTGGTIKHGDTAFYTGDQGHLVWLIPDSIPDPGGDPLPANSTVCRIRVYDPYSEPRVGDVSDGYFTLQPSCFTLVRSPARNNGPLRDSWCVAIRGIRRTFRLPHTAGRRFYTVNGQHFPASSAYSRGRHEVLGAALIIHTRGQAGHTVNR